MEHSCHMSTPGKVHQEILSGINLLGTEDEDGFDCDVINPVSPQEVCQHWEFLQNFQRVEWI